MGNEWIIDVLSDLRSFAQQNDLPLLAAQLETTSLVAAAEIDELSKGASLGTRGDTAGTQSIFGQAGTSRRAG